ncbi:type i phosphodiesterase/nucleotide pyrophosphatase [Galbibacter marinus]|uniref:Type i phosphodiesterase/nucleotide pyrophosphatase n=1 Tax=Galbibacter marinus TaxID=555500 RepID=K2QLZ4_9FLAO|nr:alkaline phosphatase PafA [Galbibacter marinus]EKF55822.1 type i phosphodiesterase/nucleotide pyrophosphatase [Galbibacter marinus]
MKKYLLLSLFVAGFIGASAQSKDEVKPFSKPKLVVGIVVDQMRYDYLVRFWDRYNDGGFKRMVNEGFNCKNNHFNYIPTYTAVGHSSVYTGTTAKVHGIIGNSWYDKTEDRMVYCTEDENANSVGTKSDAGKMSPWRLESSTVTDQLKLATVSKGKVIGVSLKDRGSILPAGHAGDAAYWFHGSDEGVWITSDYYMKELPKWVKKFNKSDQAERYKKVWNTLYDIGTYTASLADENPYEGSFKTQKTAAFPYDLPALWEENGKFDLIKGVPYGNSLTADFAMAAIEGEELGQDEITDFIAVSFSSADYVGHRFGVSAVETEDMYLRLDLDLGRLFDFLDDKVGQGEYTVFLTSDHAAVEVPAYLEDMKISGGYADSKGFRTNLNEFLKETFDSDDLVKNISNGQIFLDQQEIKELGINSREIEDAIVNEIKNYKHVAEAYTGYAMRNQEFTRGIASKLQLGYNFNRSGDVLFVWEPGYLDSSSRTGTSHGSGYAYDTHAPLLFFGKGIKHGETVKRTEIPDIANTISALLGITFPSGSNGEPISEVLQ